MPTQEERGKGYIQGEALLNINSNINHSEFSRDAEVSEECRSRIHVYMYFVLSYIAFPDPWTKTLPRSNGI